MPGRCLVAALCGLCRARGQCRRAGLADAAAHARGALCRGRLGRRQRPHHGAAHGRNPRPAGGDRERRRGGRHDRLAPRVAGAAGRLSVRDRQSRQPRRQPDALQAAALQFDDGLRAGRPRQPGPVSCCWCARTFRRTRCRSSPPTPRRTRRSCSSARAARARPRTWSASCSTWRSGINTTHIPYRGTGPALQDLVGGRLDYQCEPVPTALPLIQGNAAKPIALLARKRSDVRAGDSDRAGAGARGFRGPELERAVPAEGHARADRAPPQRRDEPGARHALGPRAAGEARPRSSRAGAADAGVSRERSSKARSRNGRRRSRRAAYPSNNADCDFRRDKSRLDRCGGAGQVSAQQTNWRKCQCSRS